MTSKQLTPLRRKDREAGYQAAVKDIVAWVADHDFDDYRINSVSLDIADEIDAKFGGRAE